MPIRFDRFALNRIPKTGLLAVLVAFTLADLAIAQSADWPYWRGPNFNGAAEASGLPDDWESRRWRWQQRRVDAGRHRRTLHAGCHGWPTIHHSTV